MNKRRRALCAALILLLLPCARAEEPLPEATAEVIETPMPETTETPAPEATPEITETPAPEATFAPTESPAPETSPEPSAAPSVEPSPEAPGLKIEIEGAKKDDAGVYSVILTEKLENIAFTWRSVEGAEKYIWSIFDDTPTEEEAERLPLFGDEQAETRLELAAADFTTDVLYTLELAASNGDSVLESASIQFRLTKPEMPDMDFPSFPGGSMGGWPGGMNNMPQEEQGFHVTPGVALTDKHAKGSKNMQRYGTVSLETTGEVQTRLNLGGKELAVTLDEGAAFTAEIDGDTLNLIPAAAGERWLIGMNALKTLNRSGISSLNLVIHGETHVLSTALEFQGPAYGALRAQGYVSKDFELQLSAAGITVIAAGGEYLLAADGALAPK